ncbi:hypothetical protein EYC80_003806 [Monilinia laxa]|uniref:Uncharacterized protein n=1 Tax=Monilinia laxa TaxID=61186 RepID=A0A5N6KL25_MONLA|nr:hypothetical protein EYC80_003806 [Monilinia laxa]
MKSYLNLIDFKDELIDYDGLYCAVLFLPQIPINYQITKLPNYQITKLPNYQITKLPNYQITKLPNYQILYNHTIIPIIPITTSTTTSTITTITITTTTTTTTTTSTTTIIPTHIFHNQSHNPILSDSGSSSTHALTLTFTPLHPVRYLS